MPELGGDQVEGRRAVHELLAARTRRVRDVWISEGLGDRAAAAEIAALAESSGVPVRYVGRDRFNAAARTEAPQGVLAHAQALVPADLEGLCRPDKAHVPFLVVLDGITDPHNLGALIRSAAVAGATGVVVPRHRAAHVTPAVTKVAAGAIEHVPIAVVGGVAAALLLLRRCGVWTVGLEPSAPMPLFDLSVAAEPIALVLGAEGPGLSRLVAQRCDVLVAIPAMGRISSLNVAAAGAVAMFEVARRHRPLLGPR